MTMRTNTDLFPPFEEFRQILDRAMKDNRLPFSSISDISEKFYAYALLLRQENEKYNLTAITDAIGIAYLHFADSLMLTRHIEKDQKILDVGSGAGFPALPLAIVRPDLSVTALDSTAKRMDFINAVAKELGLSNIRAVTARAEEFSAGPGRGTFDVVTARAVAPLGILSELCIPAVRVGGSFIAMKSGKAEQEIAVCAKPLASLGAEIKVIDRYQLITPTEQPERVQVIVRKFGPTPHKYPRMYSQIKKKPLF